MIFASYKGKELVDVEIVPISIVAETKATADGSKLMTNGADTVKVMLWNSANSTVPLCESITIQ